MNLTCGFWAQSGLKLLGIGLAVSLGSFSYVFERVLKSQSPFVGAPQPNLATTYLVLDKACEDPQLQRTDTEKWTLIRNCYGALQPHTPKP